jgi:class 3 adenylate cyclase
MSDEPNLPAQRRPSRPLPAVSDEQREKVIEELRLHCGAGALTLDEFAERAGRVWAAPTSMELDAIVADLPEVRVPTTETTPAIVGETRRRKIRKWVVAIMSGSNKAGRWRVGDSLNALCIMGGAEIDLREAEFDVPELHITAIAIMGGVSIIVPEGIDVDLGGIAIMGGKDAKLAPVPLLPGAPRIRVTAVCIMGGVDVRSKRPAAVLRAERSAKRALDREKRLADKERREVRRLEQAQKQLERHRNRHGDTIGRELGNIGREVRETLRATISEQIELAGENVRAAGEDARAAARGARPARPARPALPRTPLETTEEDAAAVRRRLKRNGRPEGTVTIMFTDIENSTEMIERLGDEDASVLVKEHNDIIRNQVAACGGYEVKFRGDGFMLAFTSAAKSVRCAIAIQEAMREFAERHPEAPCSVCIGVNSGEAVPDGDDFLGTAVNIAARLADSAHGGEVLVSSVVRDLVNSTGEFKFLPEQEIALKGISEPQRTCLVTW